MKANSTENLLLDQLFKIKPSDESISNYLLDVGSDFNCKVAHQKTEMELLK